MKTEGVWVAEGGVPAGTRAGVDAKRRGASAGNGLGGVRRVTFRGGTVRRAKPHVHPVS